MKKIFIIVFSICLLFLIACSQQKEDPRKKKVEETNATVEAQVGNFNPAYVTDKSNIHFAVKVEFDNSTFNIIPNSLQMRPGRLPYVKNERKPFAISYFDKSGKTIDQYYIDDPRALRSCDTGNPPNTKTLAKGSFYLLVPDNREITTIRFITDNKEQQRFNVDLNRVTDTTSYIR
jgi:hypothetical protein